jgi:hypothetical protein
MENFKIIQTFLSKFNGDLTNLFKDYGDLWDLYDQVESDGYCTDHQSEELEELVNGINDHLRFISEYNSTIGDYLV